MTACYLYSKANYPTIVTYDGKDLVLPPNANKFKIANKSKLSNVPKNVRVIEIKEGK